MNKCDSCEDQINIEDDVFYGSETSGKDYCETCYRQDREGSSTVYFVGPGFEFDYDNNPVTVYVSEHFVENRYGESFDDVKISRTYKSTSAWRGYFETTMEGWVEIVDGWTTGGWDNSTAQRKHLFNEWMEGLLTGKTEPNVNISIALDPTSNVFSTAVGVFVEEKNVETFTHWLDGELENLRYALS